MPPAAPSRLAIDDLVIDFAGQRLSRGGREQPLEPKAFAVLALLAGAPGQVFTRDQILDAVWGHRHVTQSVLNRITSLLRQALGEDAQNPRLLHTVHGVGYRFDLPGSAGVSDPPPGKGEGVPARSPSGSRRPWGRVALLAALVLAAASLLPARQEDGGTTGAAPATTPPSLAVLPFADLSGTGDQAHLADGLAEEIRSLLAQAPGLRVLGRRSSGQAVGPDDDARAIGRRLGVTHLLEGSVRRDGDDLRVVAQLVRAADGTQLWSKTYARELRDVFVVQEDISRDVALALSVKLDVATFGREQGGTDNVEAYERFLRWRSIVMRERFDFAHDRERLHLAREMVALDPQCLICRDALAVSLEAMAHEMGSPGGAPLLAESARVREHIARTAPESWLALRDQSNRLWREGRRVEAIALAKRIADAGPAGKERAWDYAYMIYAVGHLDETIVLVEQVRAVEPMALFLSRDLQFDYTAARRYRDAEAEYQRGRMLEGSQLEPDYIAFFRQMAGQRPGGLAELRDLHARLRQYGREFDTPLFRDLGGALGDREAMLALVRRALADPDYGGGAHRAYIWTSIADALGDADLAVAALRQELQAQDGFAQGRMAQHAYVSLWNAPYSALRAHPGFKQLLVETGVADYWRQSGRWGDGCGPVEPGDFACR